MRPEGISVTDGRSLRSELQRARSIAENRRQVTDRCVPALGSLVGELEEIFQVLCTAMTNDSSRASGSPQTWTASREACTRFGQTMLG